MKLEELEFSLRVTLDRFIDGTPYLGAVTLKREGREFILDVCQSYTYDDEECTGGTEIQCKLEVDKETFSDCPFDLTIEDLLSEDIFAEFFIESDEYEYEVAQIILMFTINGETKSIKVVEE